MSDCLGMKSDGLEKGFKNMFVSICLIDHFPVHPQSESQCEKSKDSGENFPWGESQGCSQYPEGCQNAYLCVGSNIQLSCSFKICSLVSNVKQTFFSYSYICCIQQYDHPAIDQPS